MPIVNEFNKSLRISDSQLTISQLSMNLQDGKKRSSMTINYRNQQH